MVCDWEFAQWRLFDDDWFRVILPPAKAHVEWTGDGRVDMRVNAVPSAPNSKDSNGEISLLNGVFSLRDIDFMVSTPCVPR